MDGGLKASAGNLNLSTGTAQRKDQSPDLGRPALNCGVGVVWIQSPGSTTTVCIRARFSHHLANAKGPGGPKSLKVVINLINQGFVVDQGK